MHFRGHQCSVRSPGTANDTWFKERHSSERTGGTNHLHFVFVTPQPSDILPHAGKFTRQNKHLGTLPPNYATHQMTALLKIILLTNQLNSFPGSTFMGFPVSQPSLWLSFELPEPKGPQAAVTEARLFGATLYKALQHSCQTIRLQIFHVAA